MTNAVAIAQYGSTSPNKNRIINGAMVIDQRNAGASVSVSSNTYTLDRYRSLASGGGVYSVQQSSTAPAGFVNSMIMTVTTTAASPSGTNYYALRQSIEGYNIADLNQGTANAKTFTISFWVRSSLTGTFGGSVENDFDRLYPFTYTISSANTWEQKSVTVTGCPDGTWVTTNGLGINLHFALGAGPSRSGTAGAWASGTSYSATGATNVMATNGATLYITGVQLEAGTTASPFEYRQYGTELALCQRYYNMVANYSQTGGVAPITNIVFPSATDIRAIYNFPVQMRVAPSVVSSSGSSYFRIYNGNNIYANSIGLDFASVSGIGIVSGGGTSGATQGQGGIIFANTAGAYFALSAEL